MKSVVFAVIISLSLLALLVGIAFIPQDMVPEGQYREMLITVQGYLPFEQVVEEDPQETRQLPKVVEQSSKDSEVLPKHSSYSAEDIEKVKRELLAKKRRELAAGTQSAKSVLEPEKKPAVPEEKQVVEQSHIYLIELYSGNPIYTKNLETGDSKITYETDSGLRVSIASHEVKSVQKLKLRKETVEKNAAEDK